MKHHKIIYVLIILVVLVGLAGYWSQQRNQIAPTVERPAKTTNVHTRNFPELGVAMTLSDDYIISKQGGGQGYSYATFAAKDFVRIDPTCNTTGGTINRVDKSYAQSHKKSELIGDWSLDELYAGLKDTEQIPAWVKEFDSFFLLYFYGNRHDPCFEGDHIMNRPAPTGPTVREAMLAATKL